MDPVLDGVARGQHQDVGRRVAQAQPPQHLETVDVWQADVEHDQPVRRGAQRLVGLEPCLGPIDRMPRAGEHAREPLGEQRIVFDDEDAHRSLLFDRDWFDPGDSKARKLVGLSANRQHSFSGMTALARTIVEP